MLRCQTYVLMLLLWLCSLKRTILKQWFGETNQTSHLCTAGLCTHWWHQEASGSASNGRAFEQLEVWLGMGRRIWRTEDPLKTQWSISVRSAFGKSSKRTWRAEAYLPYFLLVFHETLQKLTVVHWRQPEKHLEPIIRTVLKKLDYDRDFYK